MMRVNHDYDRGGALAYLAAYDVHQARVFGRCAPSTGIVPFVALAEQVMTTEPYVSAKRVFWIVDNGSSHRGQAAIDRLAQQFPNAVMVHTPGHTYHATNTLEALGHPYVALGQYDHARALWREALEQYQQQGRDEDAARVQRQLDDPPVVSIAVSGVTVCPVRPPDPRLTVLTRRGALRR